MADSVLLLVDAVEGPMPQTRFVTQKAFAHGLKPIVVVNKIDRPGARPDWVIDQVFDLFDNLGATDEQLDFPIVYASAINGWATLDYNEPKTDINDLFAAIVEHVAPPKVELDGDTQIQVSQLDYSSYLGIIGIGRIKRARLAICVIGRRGDDAIGMSGQRHAKCKPAFEMIGIVAQAAAQRACSVVELALAGKPIGQHQVVGLGPHRVEQLAACFDHVFAGLLLGLGISVFRATGLTGRTLPGIADEAKHQHCAEHRVTLFLEFHDQFLAAFGNDLAARKDMDLVGHDIAEQSLVMGDDQHGPLGRAQAVHPLGDDAQVICADDADFCWVSAWLHVRNKSNE